MVGRALGVVKIADLITTPFPVSPKKTRAADFDARSRRGGGAPGQFRPAPRLCSSQEVRIGLGARSRVHCSSHADPAGPAAVPRHAAVCFGRSPARIFWRMPSNSSSDWLM
jgi:hypothetical protein